MDFAMKDFELVALQTATTGDTVNVQHKKPFDIADVDSNNAMKIEVLTTYSTEIIFKG